MSNCENCRFRAIYDRNPQSMFGKIWKWHTGWCPGWKSYVKSLPNERRMEIFNKFAAFTILVIAGAIGGVSYLSFLLFLYSGAPNWVGLKLSESGDLVVNAGLCLVFFLQHSGMIRRSFRKHLAKFIPSRFQGAIYTLASGIVLLACVAFWQRSETIVWQAIGPLHYVFRFLFIVSIIGMVWGLHALGSIDMFGLAPILKHLRAAPKREMTFIVRGPYRWVRHPLYLFMIVLFWSCPVLTTDRLLFDLAWTIWVVGATLLEERDLADDFGNAYRDYQARVPMLLPWRLRPIQPINEPEKSSPQVILFDDSIYTGKVRSYDQK